MGLEIERKFLVIGDSWRQGAVGTRLRQGYLVNEENCAVRVRTAGAEAFLTVKGPTSGMVREEFEYPIPHADAERMLNTLTRGGIVAKVRYRVRELGMWWEVDEFEGDNQGLLVAEVELESVDQTIELPSWVGEEVTDRPQYLNANLAKHPYRSWG